MFYVKTTFARARGFCFWKTRFETYVKFKDIVLWEVIQNGDFVFMVEDPETVNGGETIFGFEG